jgi:thiosulfate reductase cytochrome b subunit
VHEFRHRIAERKEEPLNDLVLVDETSPAAMRKSPDRCSDAVPESLRHSFVVRVTHWIYTASFIGLVVSGCGILLAHPRLYWGETGGPGGPSLFDLPLPTMRGGPSGWGRYLHFESAWLALFAGALYVAYGIFAGHFRKNLVPEESDLSVASVWRIISNYARLKRPGDRRSYNVLQRLSYLGIVFFAMPIMIWTGLAMSPAVVSVFPFFVTAVGGHQTARTLHFFAAGSMVVFLFVHVAMVILAGFAERTRAMIWGHRPQDNRG